MRHKALIACIAAVCILTAGVIALSLWPEPGSEDPPSPPPAAADTADLIWENLDNVESVSFSPDTGAPYVIRRVNSEEYMLDAPGAIFPCRLSIMRTAYTCATSLTNLTRVAENASDEQLSLFGLDAPVMTWRVNLTDGTSVSLAAGAEQAAGKGRYARRTDSREVVLLTELQSIYLSKALEDFYEVGFLPRQDAYDDEPAWLFIEHISLERFNGDVIEIRKRTQEEMDDAEIWMSQYQLMRPDVNEGSEQMIEVLLLDPVSLIGPDLVEESFPADLAVYGLDEADRLTLSGGGWSGTLLIGRRDAERDGRYVMIEGYDAVLFDPHGDYTFLSADYAHLRMALIWLHDIKTVSSLTCELDGATRVLRLEHDTDNGADILRGRLDGNELSEDNARRLYRAALSISHNGGTDAGIPAEPPAYRFTMQFTDGGSETLELYRLNDTQFLIVLNGANQGLFINRLMLQQGFLSRFDILDRGDDLPRF